MPMLNPFDQDAFSLVNMTKAVNLIPNRYGRLLMGGIFKPQPITTDVVLIERQHNILRLLPSKPKGGPGTQGRHGKRDALSIRVPHIPVEDVILPQDYAGVRSFGSEDQLETLMSVMSRKLADNRLEFELTWEHLHWGALKGEILDADGSIMENLFDRFGITKKTFTFALDNDATDVSAKCRELCRYMETNLFGDVMTGVRVFVSQEFFDALIAHPNVEKFYLNHAATAELTKNDPRKGFVFSGVTFEEFLGQATDADGDTVRFIAEGDGHAFPEGTLSSFEFVAAPGNFLDTVNTPGEQIYARQEPRKFNQGVDIWMESNVLPICYRPQLLVACKAA